MAMVWIPPRMITRDRIVRPIPVTVIGMEKVCSRAEEMEFAWVRLPIPKEASTVNRANRKPNVRPRDLFFRPFFMVNIGPPAISPLAFTSRYLTASIHSANLLVRPKQAEIHIQTRAPGPPENMAVATPTMLPVPMVAANAVIRVENGETSPCPRFVVRASLPSTLFRA